MIHLNITDEIEKSDMCFYYKCVHIYERDVDIHRCIIYKGDIIFLITSRSCLQLYVGNL
jgi:hypothetical protein